MTLKCSLKVLALERVNKRRLLATGSAHLRTRASDVGRLCD